MFDWCVMPQLCTGCSTHTKLLLPPNPPVLCATGQPPPDDAALSQMQRTPLQAAQQAGARGPGLGTPNDFIVAKCLRS